LFLLDERFKIINSKINRKIIFFIFTPLF